MQKILCGLLLCAVILTGCKSSARNTSTPAAPAHDVPPAVYPGVKSDAPVNSGQANQAYPGPQGSNAPSAAGDVYPSSGAPAGPLAARNEYAPAAGDENMDRGNAFVELDSSSVVLLESNPPQVKLHLKGNLPNPCHKLRVNPAQPDAQKRIQVEVYSVAKPGELCTEVLQEFEAEISLGSLPTGHYSIYINGELLGEFDV